MKGAQKFRRTPDGVFPGTTSAEHRRRTNSELRHSCNS
jgi:hypothetical protein